MKELSDGTKVSSRSYYYLLDWNEQDEWKFISEEFKKDTLRQLTRVE